MLINFNASIEKGVKFLKLMQDSRFLLTCYSCLWFTNVYIKNAPVFRHKFDKIGMKYFLTLHRKLLSVSLNFKTDDIKNKNALFAYTQYKI